MPKVKWFGITVDAIEDAEVRRNKMYTGPEPKRGVYQFAVRFKMAKSGNDHDQIRCYMTLVPRDARPEEKKYRDFFMMEFVPVVDSAAFRVRALCDALGVKARDFYEKTVNDKEGWITKFGGLSIDKDGVLLLANIGPDTQRDGFWKVSDWASVDAIEESDDNDDDDDDDTPPF